jgi:hypothetical protein
MLKRFTLKQESGSWVLHDQIGDLVKAFKTKAEAIEGGVLEKLVGEGTVRVHREDGQLEEERTFPRSKDPRSSPG